MEDELVDVIILSKLEDASDFISIHHTDEGSSIQIQEGLRLGKLSKACMIINDEADTGYNIYMSRSTKRADAKYWKQDFLSVIPKETSYTPTEQYMDLAKSFIKKHVYKEDDQTQVEKHGVLYDAGEFFKNNQQYDNDSWKQEVLANEPARVEAWDQHKEEYAQKKGVSLPDNFGISNLAVQQKSKYFKSVLKLDKNFHVYVHGDRTQIEHGRDPDGRKYYKLYYEEES